jgi:hypothetical protein
VISERELSEFKFRPARDVDEVLCAQKLLARNRHSPAEPTFEVMYPLGAFDEIEKRYYLARAPRKSEYARDKGIFLSRGALFFDYVFNAADYLISDEYFCIYERYTEDNTGVFEKGSRAYSAILSSEIFGLSGEEWDIFLRFLTAFCRGYVLKDGTYLQGYRLTRSLRGTNRCTLTSAWIPSKFPYITNTDDRQYGDHISISGIIKFAQFALAGAWSGKYKTIGDEFAENMGDEYIHAVIKVLNLDIPREIVMSNEVDR